jgi:hypothetical protein
MILQKGISETIGRMDEQGDRPKEGDLPRREERLLPLVRNERTISYIDARYW